MEIRIESSERSGSVSLSARKEEEEEEGCGDSPLAMESLMDAHAILAWPSLLAQL